MPEVIYAAIQIGGTVFGTSAIVVTVAEVAALTFYQNAQRRKAERQSRDAFNASLQDRTVMIDVTPDQARTIALGRVNAVEGVRRKWVSGTYGEKLTLVVSYAGHEIDGFETHYANDLALTLDANGWCQTAPYLKGTPVSKTALITLDGSGAGTVAVAAGYVAGSASATIAASDSSSSGTVVHSGSTLNITSAFPGGACHVRWQELEYESKLRIRTWTGAPGQNVGAAIAAEYPGKITATDRFEGMAVAVIDMFYDPDVYPQPVNFKALFRGAKVLDPRTGLTVWSENNALLSYHYLRHANGWRVPAAEARTADVIAAANDCDVSTTYTLRKPDGSTYTVTLPRYRCGITIPTDADPRAAMNEIMESMAGRWGWAGGTWRMRSGMSAAPVFTLDPSWLAQRMGPDGRGDGSSPVVLSNGVTVEGKVNRITGKCVDPDQRWQVLPFPPVEDATVIAAEGETYAAEVEYQGVNHIAHAQHLARIAIRRGQAPMRMEASCNLNAYQCELFDVGNVALPRYFGASVPLMEVTGWRWHPTLGVRLVMEETAAAIYANAELTGRDPAPGGSLPSPWLVPQVAGVAVSSGTPTLVDGSILTRTEVTWTPVASEVIRQGGQIEVQYIEATATLPDGDWPSWPEQGNASKAVIPGLRAGYVYLFRVRAINVPLQVRGAWSVLKAHQVGAAPLVGTEGIESNAVLETINGVLDTVVYASPTDTGPTPLRPGAISFTRAFSGRAICTFTAEIGASNSSGATRVIYTLAGVRVYDNGSPMTPLTASGMRERRNLANGETWSRTVPATATFDFVAGHTYQVFCHLDTHVSDSADPTMTNVLGRIDLKKV